MPTPDSLGLFQQGCHHWSSLIAPVEEGSRYTRALCSSPEDSAKTIVLNYSSDTTGLPKGVEITYRIYVSDTLQRQHNYYLLPAALEEHPTDRWLCFLPMYHAFAQTVFVVGGPFRGIPVYVMPRFDFLKMLGYVQNYAITVLILVPPVIVAIAKHSGLRAGNWDLSSFRRITAGAAPLGKEVNEEVETCGPNTPQAETINVRQG